MSDPVLSAAALFIAKWEGFNPNVYKCPAGIPTFGYGSLVAHYPDAKFPITTDQGVVFLEKDIHDDLKYIDFLVTAPINLNQTVALISFVYNVGEGNFKNSTLLRMINLLQYTQAADQFLRWTLAGKRVLPGLVSRRKAERTLFLTP